MLDYTHKKERLVAEIAAAPAGGVRLGKQTSNLFRERQRTGGHTLDVKDFNNVLEVNPEQAWVEVEGMTTYERFVDGTLSHGVMPAVVPQLKTITIGGAISGIGIESSSFKFGLPHETVLAMDVLLGHGEVVTCTPDNDLKDLFYGFPNSYGTLGYILKLKTLTVAVKPYVEIHHTRCNNAMEFFETIAQSCCSDADFVDGSVFSENEVVVTTGRFVDEAPFTSDYTYLDIYYQSILQREQDYLTIYDYIWRWDTDWFWCSKNLYAQNQFMRRLLGRQRLNSRTYTKVMRWNTHWGITRRLNSLVGNHPESVIQDVDIPIDNAAEFLAFFQREIRIKPIWICPIGAYNKSAVFDLYPMNTNKLYINFGFWDVVRNRQNHPAGHYNRLIEKKVAELGGVKSLYSDSYFTEQEFWSIYNREHYEYLKSRYDPQARLKNLYQKVVLKQ
ncbi:MAG: FAD-binding protein [Gammaproteobacteria bacterium]|nr:FAD-binding protein [Gammaproteobacteria bacterium]